MLVVCKFVIFFLILNTFAAKNMTQNAVKKIRNETGRTKFYSNITQECDLIFYFILLTVTQVKKYLTCHGFEKYFVCTIFFAQLSCRNLATFKFKLNNGNWLADFKYVSLTMW